MNPVCPYCNTESKFVDSATVYRGKSYGMIYDCRACDAYVGVHKGTEKALGTLANRELRQWRMKAHAAFDPLWQRGRMPRRQAYAHMQTLMGMAPDEAHISRFSVEQCQRLVMALSTPRDERKNSTAPSITRRTDFSLPDCDCKCPPWEHCEHSTQHLGPDQAAHMLSIRQPC